MSITINPWSKSQWVLAASVFNIRKCVCVGYWTSYWPPSSPRDSLAAPLLAGGNSAEPREFKTVQVAAGGPRVGRLTGISLPTRAGTTSATLLGNQRTVCSLASPLNPLLHSTIPTERIVKMLLVELY